MKDLNKFINYKFKDFPNNQEVKLLKEEMYDSLKAKYERLLTNGKTEKQAYKETIEQFGDIQELRREFESVTKGSKIQFNNIYFMFITLISLYYIISHIGSNLGILFHTDAIFFIFTNCIILFKLYKNVDFEWGWISLIFAVFMLTQKVIPLGYVFIIIGILAFFIYKFKLWKINLTLIISILLTISFFIAFNFNSINSLDSILNNNYWNQLLLINKLESSLYLLTFLLNLYIFLKYIIHFDGKVRIDLYLFILLLLMNASITLINYYFIYYFSILPLIFILFVLIRIKKISSKHKYDKVKLHNLFNIKSSILLTSILIILTFTLGSIMKSSYLFLPYELNKNNRYHSLYWRKFKLPVYIEVYNNQKIEIKDPKDIKEFIKLLDDEPYLTTTKEEWEHLNHMDDEERGNYIKIQICRTLGETYEGSEFSDIIYEIDFYDNQSYISTNHRYYTFSMTNEIKEFLDYLIEKYR